MKAALLIVLSLSALAFAGPAFNKNSNKIDDASYNKANQQQYMTTGYDGAKQGPTVELLKQWCFASQMSQPELTASFKKLVGVVKSNPADQTTESAVMSERICQGAINSAQKTETTGQQQQQQGADAQAHELIKDVYMDALISCKSRECTEQLVKIINSNKVDTIRASYYMTRIAVTEKDSIKDNSEIKQLAESFINGQGQEASEAIERQKLFAITSLIGKSLKTKPESSSELKQTAEQVAKTIVERYIKPVGQQEVQQYQQEQQPSQQIAKKIAKRNAALKALANIPGFVLKECAGVEDILTSLIQNKQEMITVRQSAIECLEQNESALQQLKQITFDQQEPIEVRVAAYRALMTVAYTGVTTKDESAKQQMATEIVDQIVKHCEEQANQQNDEQFVLYAISHLDNIRTSQQPEHQAIKECITKNKQHYMQIQVLCKKFKQQLSDVRKSSRNYKLEQEFNQIESGLVIEGDLVYESKQSQWASKGQILPKLVRVNMSMPVMGETVNVVEMTLRQHQMDDEILSALKLVKGVKFNSESMSKVVDSFKSSVEQQQQQQQQQQQYQRSGPHNKQQAEADLTIKVDGCTVVYLCVDDFKSSSSPSHQRNTRSSYSIVDEIIEHLKRKPVAFNRGFNFNLNERIAKVLDVDANVIAGLRFQSYAKGPSSNDFEIVAQIEPRFGFEAIVGPAKMSSKKLLQRASTKTALGLRLRYKSDELVDVQVDLPMNTMELFTVETQMVEKSTTTPYSYNYLPESVYGQEDIYTPEDIYYSTTAGSTQRARKFKRSIFDNSNKSLASKSFALLSGKSSGKLAHTYETPENVARATGLRGKVRVVASPKDMTFYASAIVQKYEPSMQGYRFQVQKVQRSGEQQQYLVSVSTPGSRLDRTMQLRVIKSANSQRTIIKSDIQSPKMGASMLIELIHDGRQYAIKTELASTRGKQWRHSTELGYIRSSPQSQTGRAFAVTYKPYLQVESSYMKRPISLQGVVSYQQSPKTVISYELKCQTTGDFVQGKIILDERQSSVSRSVYGKRTFGGYRRSMSSPIEYVLEKDITLTAELIGQIQEHAVKVHQMIDWDRTKWALNADYSASYKNLRKSIDSQILASMKLDQDQQIVTVERKCPQQERKEYRVTIASDCRSPNAHQFAAEARYNGRRQSVIAYKHKINYNKISSSKFEYGLAVEFVDTERQINEKLTGRTRMMFERKMKSVQCELSSRNQQAKVDLEYVSLNQHQLSVILQGERTSHKTEIRANQRQFAIVSRTDKHGQLWNKIVVEVSKPTGECQLVVELPTKRTHVAADIKLTSGKLSSLAIQTPRFASKGEFSFETLSHQFGGKHGLPSYLLPTIFGKTNLRFKSDLKDAQNNDAYWMDSAWNADLNNKSFFRFDSPIYRTDLEFDPSELNTKIGMYARSKRSIDNYNSLYSDKESSLLNSIFDIYAANGGKMNLGNKLWVLRTVMSSPSQLDSLKSKARRALFEYADRRQAHKHQFDYNPTEQRLSFALEQQPNTEYPAFAGAQWQPMRFTGDIGTNLYKTNQMPSKLSLESEYMNLDVDAMPYNGDEAYAKISALSRYPRSAFKKHESQVRYSKDHGYKAWMKHEDSKNKRHSWQLEADKEPKKWAKLSYESDKHGKGEYEHNWRKYVNKRSHPIRTDEEEDVYSNKVSFRGESPRGDWQQSGSLEWDEPIKMLMGYNKNGGRVRRDLSDLSLVASEAQRQYTTADYLKHVNARLSSHYRKNQADQYNVDFDYQPQLHAARLNVQMPEDMLHSSSFELSPSERLYKLQSKLYNQRTNEPSYDFLATAKQPSQLATADQEPVFVDYEHPMLERPITGSLMANLFKQPMKLAYSDKYGRIARFDYDQSPITGNHYSGLRQKRAAVYYKDDSSKFEHNSLYDFYPEAMFGFKPSKRVPGDITLEASTRYGPVMVRVKSNDDAMFAELESPVFNGKLVGEGSQHATTKIVKMQVDNKQQQVPLTKIIRKIPVLRDCSPVYKWASKLDKSRFEHQSELLVNVVEAIFKLKSQTRLDQRPVLMVEGELNMEAEKLVAKVSGERVKGHLVVDLISKSANLVMEVDDKRTFQHVTRLVRVSDKFYSLDSMTTYQQQPLFKLSGKVSSMVFSEPSHLFARRRSGLSGMEPHVSTFEAVIYEPKEMRVSAKYDCLNKEARIILTDVEDKKASDVRVQYDERTERVFVDARTTSPRGIEQRFQKSVSVAPFVTVY